MRAIYSQCHQSPKSRQERENKGGWQGKAGQVRSANAPFPSPNEKERLFVHMMERKTKSLLPLLLLLGFSCLLALGTVQASRSLASGTQELNHQKLTQEPPALSIADQDAMEEQLPAVAEALVRGRMDIQSFNDYPGSGANNRHDPKPPRSG